MSKSANKHEKFSCLANCLPLKGIKGKKRSSSIPKTDCVVYNLTSGGGKSEVPFGPEDGKSEHTKQWLHNLSTMVSFDPSYLDDSQLSGDATMLAENSLSPESTYGTQIEKGSADIYRESVPQDCRYDTPVQQDAFRRPTAVIRAVNHNKRGYTEDSYRSSSRDSRRHRDPHHDVDVIKARINNSLASDISNMDSFQSSVLCDSSHLSSKCCSQQRHRRRRATDRSRTSSSTIDYRGLNRERCDADTSSMCSGSTVSLATEMITLNVDTCSNLGITIVGHSNGQGDCGIFVGCVKKDGAVAQSGRFEPGDLILEVNGIDLEHMANERALTVLKGELAKGGIVRILVAKYWDMNSSERGAAIDEGCRLEPLYEPAGSVRSVSTNLRRPASTYGGSAIEKAATMSRASNTLRAIQENNNRVGRPSASLCNEQMKNNYADGNVVHMGMGYVGGPASSYQVSGPSSSGSSIHGYPDSGYHEGRYGTTGSCHSLKGKSATLDRRSRNKEVGMNVVSLPRGVANSTEATQQPFRGIELIDWIEGQVVGLKGRREAQTYAQNLLKTGHIFNTDPRQGGAFEEHNYYIFGKNALAFSEGSLQSKML